MTSSLLEEATKLSLDERIELVEAIWDSIAHDAAADDLPLADEHRLELDRRLAELETHPDDESPWEEVRARI